MIPKLAAALVYVIAFCLWRHFARPVSRNETKRKLHVRKLSTLR